MSMPFVHLHVHSQYSLLDGACRVGDLIATAMAMNMPAVSLTDHGNMFGAIEFYQLAQKKGIKPIIGCETYVASGSRHDRKHTTQKQQFYHLTLLARNRTGYNNLIRLISIAYAEGFYYKPRIDRQVLAQYSAGLIGLSGCLKGEIASHLLNAQQEQAYESAKVLRNFFEPDCFYLELMDHGLPEQQKINPLLIDLSEHLAIPLVATNDVHYLKKDMARAHEILLCLQTQTTLSDAGHMRMSSNEFYFKSPAEMSQLFAAYPAAIANTVRVAEQCALDLDFSKTHLPSFPVPESLSAAAYVRRLCEQRLPLLYTDNHAAARERLDTELTVINSLGYDSYFLIVADFVNYAGRQGIPVGPGRGSAAGSIVSYLLGITTIDPLKYDLLFERFLNPDRVSPPDIDIDFCYERRDEVIAYVTEKYGRDNVAQIITFGTMAAKGVIRDVGRVMDIPYAEADKIAKMVPDDLNITLAEALESSPDLKQAYVDNQTVKALIDTAQVLEGLTRHSSTHAAGVVISDAPLYELIPLYKSNDGAITTGFSMSSLEKIGLLKMDFLGLKTLTVISEAIAAIQRTQGVVIDVLTLDLTDSPTYALLSKAQTLGVFQLESSGMRDILRKLTPDKFEDIIALLALYRPGPLGSGMVEDFIKRKRTGAAIVYDHPLLEPILRDTYGIILYQEQVMRITNVLAGFSLAQADLMRRAMGKKNPEIIEGLKKNFIEGAAARGVETKIAAKIFGLIEYFAGYGFNKSHSAAYALISFQTAYLKANYPVEFMSALLTSERENTDKLVEYIAEAKRLAIEVLPPDVNESLAAFTVTGTRRIRFGLAAVKNVGQAAVNAIIAERAERGPFSSLSDFCQRLDTKTANKKTLESLIKSGACDSFPVSRAQLLAELEPTMAHAAAAQRDRQSGQLLLFNIDRPSRPAVAEQQLPSWSRAQLLAFEKEMLGFYLTGHPLEEHTEKLRRYRLPAIVSLAAMPADRPVAVAGVIKKVKTTFTKKTAEKMAVLQLEDEQNTIDVIVFPSAYQNNQTLITVDNAVVIIGRLDRREQTPKVITERIIALEDAASELSGTLRLTFSPASLTQDSILPRLKTALVGHPGQTNVQLIMQAQTDKRVNIRARQTVRLSPELFSELEQLLGQENVSVALALGKGNER